ncbi:MAG: ECF-type sigma factor [Planctomycetota bacterium]
MLEVTQLLERIEDGDQQAAGDLMPIVYEELRKLARSRMSRESADHTLQTTALVHEAYVRLVDRNDVQKWDHRGHFFAAAAEAMRRILVDHARRKLGPKRGGDRVKHVLPSDVESRQASPEEIVQVSDCVEEIAKRDTEAAELIKLHCFAGFSVVEAAEILGISKSKAYLHWNYAKALVGKLIRDDS